MADILVTWTTDEQRAANGTLVAQHLRGWLDGADDDALGLADPAVTYSRGRLTTDHMASSYGLPVLVTEDGTVLGPADLGDVLLSAHTFSVAERDVEAARKAGYRLDIEHPAHD